VGYEHPAMVLLSLSPFGAQFASVDMLPILGGLVLILLAARLGSALFTRLGQPAVLGELAAGIALGNLGILGWHGLDGLRSLLGIEVLAQIGILFLLFQVGLESDVGKMLAVGASSFTVAVLGVVVPMALGFGVFRWLFPDQNPLVAWFVGATLCATSVGITARVLSDLGRGSSKEGRVILGAAVIDDVLGLIVLAIVVGAIGAADRGADLEVLPLMRIVGQSILFIVVGVLAGSWLSRTTLRLATRFGGEALLLSLALAFCFGLSYLAGKAGLAPIVGAFAAGLVLDEARYADPESPGRAKREVAQLLHPIAAFLVPIFFVLMGMRVDVRVFGSTETLGFAAFLTLAAVLGKQVCSLGVLDPKVDRWAVGLGMIPRGEVGLVFASVGTTLKLGGERVVSETVFSSLVAMVAFTTLLTPPLLAWRLRWIDRSPARR
jgi:Kef-type K+ transport system membrane component KefB